MRRLWIGLTLLGWWLGAAGGAGAADEGKVQLPLSAWEGMRAELEAAAKPEHPEIPYCPLERSIEGVFHKGLLRGTLSARFEVLEDRGHVRVPILDGGASLGQVLLNGKATSLLREGGLYTLGVDQPGVYNVRLEFFLGQEQDRFARRLGFRLPEAGPTRFSVLVPEADIEPQIRHGALTARRPTAEGTRLEGQLDASGLFDLSWSRRLTHRSQAAVRLAAKLNALFTVHDAVMNGLAVFDLDVLEGETDRVDLRLPAGVEVLQVEGDAVLQWRTDAADGGRLTVLLRYLVEDRLRLNVQFQFPSEAGKPVELLLPLPPAEASLNGAIGIQGPAGLNVQVASVTSARQLELRDLPPDLTELTPSPVLFGFRFEEPPRISLTIARHQEVQLTSTLVDELQASSVLLEDGTEITKLKLRIRNNTRQYLKLRLPPGSVLTHSLIDGRPVRPAQEKDGRGETLLLPLRQSERIGAGRRRTHRVREGETLSDLANFYYSDPNQWQLILQTNPDELAGPGDVYVGQNLIIPTPEGITVEESSFIIELAYQRPTGRELGWIGSRNLRLPECDVDVMRAVWHLYFPSGLEPLSFDANMTQTSAIRYDPFRRLRDYLIQALWVRSAWAGGMRYKSILLQRKDIYRAEGASRGRGEGVLAAFPLVGERYRFKRTLMGRDTPAISVVYIDRDWAAPVRWLGLLAAFCLATLLLAGWRSARRWLVAVAGVLVLLWLAHYFLGMHRRILWGVDLALLLAIARLRWRPAWARTKEIALAPWRVLELLTLGNLLFVIGLAVLVWLVLLFPLLLSSFGALALLLWWRRKDRLARQEVSHA